MKVVLATGVLGLNKKIERTFQDELEIVSRPLYNEAVERSVANSNADLIILSDQLSGSLEIEEIILTLRARHPKTRIIIIFKNLTKEMKNFLYKYNVFDILTDRFTEETFRNTLLKPKSWEDVAGEMESLQNYAIDEELYNVDLDSVRDINKNEYKKILTPSTGKNNIYQEIIPFWSTIDQTGKTFTLINSGILMASNPDLKILILDFNVKNPSVHLQFGFTDGDRNLGAFIEDTEDEIIIGKDEFIDYLIVHPVYKNLSILPGYILNIADKTDSEYINYFNQIIEFASSNNYSTILVDTHAGLNELNLHILKNATKVMLVVNESPNALYSTKKMFDPELGEYIPTLLGKRRLFPVINMSLETFNKKFKIAFELILEGNPVIASIGKSEEIHESIYNGSPFTKEPTSEIYSMFFPIMDIIHPDFFKKLKPKPKVTTESLNTLGPTSNNKQTNNNMSSKKNFGLFGKK